MTEEVVLNQLLKRPNPKANKTYFHWNVTTPYDTLQLDLLFLPHDGQYKYALTCVDVASRYKWAAPVKTKQPNAILAAFNTFNIPIIRVKTINVDAGTEFKGNFAAFVKKNNITLRVNKPGFHLSFVENLNGQLAQHLFRSQFIEELRTGKEATKWVNNLQSVVTKMNHTVTANIKMTPAKAILLNNVPQRENKKVSLADSKLMYPIGTKVRRLLRSDEILDIPTKKITIGKRRRTDPLWSLEIYSVFNAVRTCVECPISHTIENLNGEIYPHRLNYWQLQVV